MRSNRTFDFDLELITELSHAVSISSQLLTRRRRWDSNPRCVAHTRFPIVLLRPLGHSSSLARECRQRGLIEKAAVFDHSNAKGKNTRYRNGIAVHETNN